MTDQYRIRHNTNLAERQLDNTVDEISKSVRANRFSEYYAILNSLFRNSKNYLTGLFQPSFTRRPAQKLPLSEEYNKNAEEIANDIGNAYDEIYLLRDNVVASFNHAEMFNAGLEQSLKQLKKEADDMDLYIETPEDIVISASDDFSDLSQVDEDATTAHVQLLQGTVTLGVEDHDNHNDADAEFEVMDDSNGFPGNFHKVRVEDHDKVMAQMHEYEPDPVSDTAEGITGIFGGGGGTDNIMDVDHPMEKHGDEIEYYGEENPRLYFAAIQDEDPDTWVEYELVNVDDYCKDTIAEGYGWEYQEGDKWARDPDRGYLNLHIRITLPEPVEVNWIDVNPYYPDYDGVGDIIVRSIKTAPDKESTPTSIYDDTDVDLALREDINKSHADSYSPFDLPGDNDFAGRGVFTFAPRLVQTIDFVFEQHSAYDCMIGHIYHIHIVEKEITEESWFGLSSSTEREVEKDRIEGPLPSREEIVREAEMSKTAVIAGGIAGGVAGGKIGSAIGSAFGPIGAAVGGALGAAIGSLWGGTEVEVIRDEVESGIEAFPGWRYAIGLREVNINSFLYEESSRLVSEPYQTPEPVRRVELDVNEQTPEVFYDGETEETDYGARYDWIEYYFSIDDGSSWHQIAPRNHQLIDVPKTYYINANHPPEMHRDDAAYIEADSDVHEVLFMARFKRPTEIDDAAYHTPVLRKYNLQLTSNLGEDEG